MKPRRGRGAAILIALMLAALALRIPALDRSLWYDELFSYQTFIADRALWQSLWTYRAANNHPLYSALAWLALRLPLGLELALRLPALILGILILPAADALARRLGFDRAGLIAAAFLAISPGAILYSQEARGYAGAGVAVTLVFFALIRPGREQERAGAYALITAAIIAAGGFHPAAAIITLAAAAPWLARAFGPRGKPDLAAARILRRRLAAWALGHGLLFVLALPILKRVLSFARRNVLVNGAIPWRPWDRVLDMTRAWTSWDGLPWSALILFPLAVFGARTCLKRGGLARDFVLAFSMASGLTLAFWLSPGTLFFPRFVLPLQGGLLVLAAIGLDAALVCRPAWGRWLVLAAVFGGVGGLHLGPWRRWSGPGSELQDLRGAIALARTWSGDTGVVAAGGLGGELIGGYAGIRVFLVANAKDLQALRQRSKVVYIEPYAGSSIGPVDRILDQAEERRAFEGQRATVVVYRLGRSP